MKLTIPRSLQHLSTWQAYSLCLIAGALMPLGLAPFDLWPVSLLALALFALLLQNQGEKVSIRRAFAFGLGMFGIGVSWVYVSIHDFGGASPLLAGVMTLIFVAFLAWIFALPFWLSGRFFSNNTAIFALAFPVIWMLGEWLRSWLLTGFPWLYLGYSQLHTPLAGWAPVVGVIGVSLLCAISALALALLASPARRSKTAIVTSAVALVFWISGAALKSVNWTQLDEQPIRVGMVQPDIAQDIKWELSYVEPTVELLTQMTEELWENDWVIWPEAAIPLTYHQALPFLNVINDRAAETGSGLVTGIIFDDREKGRYYNSIAGFGEALGIYHKRRLVPFGEYVPLENWLRGLIQFFNLPTSIISAGPWEQHNMRIKGTTVTPAVCYELAYPDLLAKSARNSAVLLSVSNLGWFGTSIGPHQFMQMAQMRSLETGRYLIYSTNNGSSALIDPKGKVTQQSGAFTRQNLEGEIYAANGNTPFMRLGSWPLALLGMILLIISGWFVQNKKRPL